MIFATRASATSSVAPVDVPKKTPAASREVELNLALACLEEVEEGLARNEGDVEKA